MDTTDPTPPPATMLGAMQDASGEKKPERDPSREQLVKDWIAKVKAAKKHFEQPFKQMREDMLFAANRNGEQWNGNKDKYVANITQRHIQQKVASLYAKNPQVRVQRKPRMDFSVWDGKAESLNAAFGMAQQAMTAAQVTLTAPNGQVVMQPGMAGPAPGMPPVGPQALASAPPQEQQLLGMIANQMLPQPAQALLADVKQGLERKQMLEKIGRTGELLFKYFMSETEPKLKPQLKQAVRRALTAGVAYVRLDFQRLMGSDRDPTLTTKIADAMDQLTRIQQLQDQITEGEDTRPDDARIEELRLMIQNLQAQAEIIVREGPIWDFPASTAVIPDPKCTQLTGWVNADWIAIESILDPEVIEATFGADIDDEFTAYDEYDDKGQSKPRPVWESRADTRQKKKACVWGVYDKTSGLVYWICDGYGDFLKEPSAPNVQIERFFPIWALSFNELENEGDLFPPSDVRLMMHQQKEYNRSREALRQHRIASQPFYVSTAGTMTEDDRQLLASRVPHSVLELDGLPQGADAKTVLQSAPVTPVDPNLYETSGVFTDVTYVVGSQEASFGGTSDSTATEVAVAAQSTAGTLDSNRNDLDEFLSDVARATFEVMLLNMDPTSVKNIVGPGAVWPEMSRSEIEQEIYMEVVAGSSGRPNRAQEIANLERMSTFIQMIPGISPEWLARKAVQLLDDSVDLEEAVAEGQPSLSALNAMAKPAMNTMLPPPSAAPQDQGAQGANNAEQPPMPDDGAQPAFPTGNPTVLSFDAAGNMA